MKGRIFMNIRKTLLSVASLVGTLAATSALAQEGGNAAAAHSGIGALGPAIAIGVAALGGGLGQGRAAAAALEGIARNPNASGKLFVPMILGLVFIESLVIYAFIVALR